MSAILAWLNGRRKQRRSAARARCPRSPAALAPARHRGNRCGPVAQTASAERT